MNTTDSYSPNYNQTYGTDETSEATGERRAVAAIFGVRESAHDAVHRLHDEGFRDTWIGIARSENGMGGLPSADAIRVEAENWFMRFFGDGDESLHDALVRRGVSDGDASAAGAMPPRGAVLTVDGANHPELAAQIVTQSGGELVTRGFGATGYGTAGTYRPDDDRWSTDRFAEAAGTNGSQAPAARTTSLYDEGVASEATVAGRRDLRDGSDMLSGASAASDTLDPEYATGAALVSGSAAGKSDHTARYDSLTAAEPKTSNFDATSYDDYGRFRGGTPIDESTRFQLREERLRVDKSRVARAEATIATDVTTQTQDLDVPVMREELFVERRPVSGAAASDATAIGDGDVIRIPLTEERLTVTKTPVVIEEVIVGKRQVEEMQHISDTTRKERLTVTDAGPVSDSDPVTATRDR